MSDSDESFGVLASPQEYRKLEKERDQFKTEVEGLIKHRDWLEKEREQLITQTSILTQQLQIARKHTHKIAKLSKNTLRLGTNLLKAKEEADGFKEKMKGMRTIEEMELGLARKEEEWKGKLLEVQQATQLLQEHADSLKILLQDSQEKKAALQEQLNKREEEVKQLLSTVAKRKLREQQLLGQVGLLMEKVEQQQLLILNESNRSSQLQKKITEQKASLKQFENMLDLKSKEINQTRLKLDQAFKDMQMELQAKFIQKQEQLQDEYKRRITSIKDFMSSEEEIERLHEIIVKQEKDSETKMNEIYSLRNQITQLNKKIHQVEFKMSMRLAKYKDPENAQHLAISFYINHLTAFRDKLKANGEPNISLRISHKKTEMLSHLEKELQQSVGV